MPNDLRLQEGHPVDENLRPIKVGGKSTAIETAQHGNGARINGDLKVTGTISGNINDAGIILGYTTVGIDAADDAKTLGTSFGVTDSAHKVKFVAPSSGVVEIFVSIYADFARRQTYFGLSDNATYNTVDITHEHSVALPPSATGDRQINHHWVITGLTAGNPYEYWLGAKTTHSFATTLKWGGDVGGEYAPFIMKVTALPTAVADYAVYG